MGVGVGAAPRPPRQQRTQSGGSSDGVVPINQSEKKGKANGENTGKNNINESIPLLKINGGISEPL